MTFADTVPAALTAQQQASLSALAAEIDRSTSPSAAPWSPASRSSCSGRRATTAGPGTGAT